MQLLKKTFTPVKGVCCRLMEIEYFGDGVIARVTLHGGCDGNSKGLSLLLQGMEVVSAKRKLRGVCCGRKNTSCPDQLSMALQEIEEELGLPDLVIQR